MARLRDSAARELVSWTDRDVFTIPHREDWMDRGLCVGRWSDYDFDVKPPTQTQARDLCAGCPVVGECRDFARSAEEGVPVRARSTVMGAMTPAGRYLEDVPTVCTRCSEPHRITEDGAYFSQSHGIRCKVANDAYGVRRTA